MEENIGKVMKLVQKYGTFNYKLIIPDEVERKIRYTCQKVWDTEWSGTLFFTYEGSFENNDLVIRCVDFFVMDIGTQAYTEFDMNPDVIAYMCEHELLDCQMGLIHSHNNMSTFFSGTDTATLREEGTDRNNFVSLIVNNAGTYTAAITRRVKNKKIKESVSYEFFGDGAKSDDKEYTSTEDEIEWFYLHVEKQAASYDFPEIGERLDEIRKAKQEKAKLRTPYPYAPDTTSAMDYTKEVSKDTKPKSKESEGELPFSDNEIPYGVVHFNEDTIKSLVLQIITGSIVVSNNTKLDIEKWASMMSSLYEKRFGKGKEGMDTFKIWAETYTEFLTWYVTDKELEDLGFDESEIGAICAHDIIEELTKLPENDYINVYIDALQKYLIL